MAATTTRIRKAKAGSDDHVVLRALASAARQEIVDVLASSGPVTVAQLARLLGRRPDALYFHLHALERAGIVRACQPRRIRGRASALFELPAPILLDYARAPRRELARVVRMAVRLALREFERECLSGKHVRGGAMRRLWGGRVMGWVGPRELARVNELLAELHTVLRSGHPGKGREAISIGFLLSPAGSGERARRSRRKESS